MADFASAFPEWGICVAGLLAGAGLARLLAGWLARQAELLGLMVRSQARSSHEHPTPHGGGLGIVLGFTLVAGLVLWRHPQLREVVLLSLPLALVGFWDDLGEMPVVARLGVQILVCVALLAGPLAQIPAIVVHEGLRIEAHWLFGTMLLAGVWWVNLFNFMDGIDGIAGGQAISMSLLAAAMIAAAHPEAVVTPVWCAILLLAVSSGGFLSLNWSPARIFMGDVGSTWLAVTLFAIALLSVESGWMTYTAWLILAAVFVADASVTLAVRVVRGERWYRPHRNHAYQKLARLRSRSRAAAHRWVSLLVISINSLWLAPLAWLSLHRPDLSQLWLALAYLPLIAGVMWTGAGRPDSPDPATSA
ncbi:MAG: glycosyltransferase family 4 protein [Pseudomonadota bacterium]